jgi:hypothetical protein
MIVECEKCSRVYNDEFYLTICPHNSLDGACRKHDLYFCNECRVDHLISLADEADVPLENKEIFRRFTQWLREKSRNAVR